jgi:CHAT domain-containing protein
MIGRCSRIRQRRILPIGLLLISLLVMGGHPPIRAYLHSAQIALRHGLIMSEQEGHHLLATILERSLDAFHVKDQEISFLPYVLIRQLGDSLFLSQAYANAVHYQQKALDTSDQRFGAESKESLGRLSALVRSLYFLDQYEKAIPLAERALTLSRRWFGDESLETAEVQSLLALHYSYNNRDSEALTLAHQALRTRILKQGLLEEDTIEQLRIYAEAGRNLPLGHERGAKIDEIALALSAESVGWESVRTETILNDIDWFYRQLGDCTASLPYAEESLNLTLRLEGENTSEAANRFHSLGTVHYCLGDLQKAIHFTEQALLISRSIFGEWHSRVAYLKAELADWHEQAGHAESARQLAQSAIEILNQSMGLHHPNAPDVLDFVATAALSWDVKWSKSLSIRYLNAMREAYGDDDVALVDPLLNLANAELILGDIDSGLRHARRAVDLSLGYAESHHQLPDEDALDALVLAESTSGHQREALKHALMALRYAEFRSGLNHPYTSHAYQQLASALRKKRPSIAIALLKRAIELELHQLPTAPEEYPARNALMNALIVPHCQRLRSWLIADGRRTETGNMENQDACTHPPPLTDREAKWLESYDAISRRRIAMDGPIRRLKAEKQHGSVSHKDILLAEQLESRIVKQAKSLDRLINAKLSIKRKNAPIANEHIQRIKHRLRNEPPDTAWIHYTLDPGQIVITWVTRNQAGVQVQPIQDPLFSSALKPEAPNKKGLEALYRALIRPIRDHLNEAHIHTLLIDAASQIPGLPFAAFHDEKDWLLNDYAISTLHGSSTKGVSFGPHPAMAVFGNSIAMRGFKPLPKVEEELKTIERMARERGLNVDAFPNQAFTKASIRDSIRRGKEILNIATHYIPSPGRESASSLLLGNGDYLTAKALTQEFKASHNVRLVSLSACETGPSASLGMTKTRGYDLMTQLVLSGVPNVIGTLWPVRDDESLEFMTRFYGHLFDADLSIREAFHQTQKELMKEGRSLQWAAFTLLQK